SLAPYQEILLPLYPIRESSPQFLLSFATITTFLEGGFDIVPEVVGAFEADVQADKPACPLPGHAHDMIGNPHANRRALETAPTAPDAEVAQRIDEAIGGFASVVFEGETEQAAGSTQLLAGEFRLRVGREARIVDRFDGGMLEQGGGDAARVLLMALHT